MLLNVYKPKGMTSHDVVDEVRKITGEKRVGHAGTLDPLAQGVLVIGVSRESTKRLKELLQSDKEYVALLELGKESSTGDSEGEIKLTSKKQDVASLQKSMIQAVLEKFTGEIEQTPPLYSAIKIKGVPAYKLAREGKLVSLKKRKVTIYSIALLSFDSPFLKLKVVVSSGTYIRSLAKDIGRALRVGAYLSELTRTRVGAFNITKSKTLQELSKEYAE